jgi:MFS family permease
MGPLSVDNDSRNKGDSSNSIAGYEELNDEHDDTNCGDNHDGDAEVLGYERMYSSTSQSTTVTVQQQNQDDEYRSSTSANQVLMNFVLMSCLFSANHGAMVSCLAFATLQLGSTGAWELSLFHLIYAASALLGATYIVKQLGSRNSMMLGMVLYAGYVTLFWLALLLGTFVNEFAVLGAFLGGIGGGFVWTAQGSYFGRAAEDYAQCCGNNKPAHEATSFLAGIFAFIYLAEEVACKMLSWVLLQETSWSSWTTVIGVYSVIAIVSAILMVVVHPYPILHSEMETSMWYKATCAWHLLTRDPKMKYMVGLNAVFGLACPFVNAYVNGEVVQRVLLSPDGEDTSQRYVGLFSALSSAVAALCCLLFGSRFLSNHKGVVLILGALSFVLVVLPFIIQPDFTKWNWVMLALVYCFQGMGRSTFEGALRAVFADYFPNEKEGSYANIILQNGAFTSLGFLLSFYVPCNDANSKYCVDFAKDGDGRHNMLVLELGVVVTAFLSILGFLRAQSLHRQELQNREDYGEREFFLNSNDHDDQYEEGSLGDTPCNVETALPSDFLRWRSCENSGLVAPV